jgi:hypothetical protein
MSAYLKTNAENRVRVRVRIVGLRSGMSNLFISKRVIHFRFRNRSVETRSCREQPDSGFSPYEMLTGARLHVMLNGVRSELSVL